MGDPNSEYGPAGSTDGRAHVTASIHGSKQQEKFTTAPTLSRLASMVRPTQPTEEEQEERKTLRAVRKPPLITKWNLIPCLLFLGCMLSGAYYFYIRFRGVINLGWPLYQSYFLALELLGVSAFVPYAILITRGVFPTGSNGLPAAGKLDHAAFDSSAEEPLAIPNLHVRVLVPCYKEPMEVIHATIMACLNADLPINCERTVYLCDDGKDPNKRVFIETLAAQGYSCNYVSGRVRKKGEVNGKSANLNNCLKNVIFAGTPRDKSTGEIDWTEISNRELLVVFDADMCANTDFFLKLLEVMVDDNISLCLTPQSFHNVDSGIDLFNAINKQFWEYWLPGAFAWGYIACTGTNFCLRARALAHCGWFPEYTITEDYALGMELKSHGYKATYLMDYIAAGEAPEEIRNVFRQRSRWTKGHFQVFFSKRCPLLNWELPFFQRLWYSYAAWSPLCTVITIPAFMLAPLLSVFFGIHPVSITFDFVLASTVYLVVQYMIQFYVRDFGHLKLMWYVNLSNIVLWFTYTKAFINSMMGVMGMKAVMFKATDKVVKGDGGVPLLGTGPAKPGDSNAQGPRSNSLVRAASRTMSRVGTAIRDTFRSSMRSEQQSDVPPGVQLQAQPTLERGVTPADSVGLAKSRRLAEVASSHASSMRQVSLRRRPLPVTTSEHEMMHAALTIAPSSKSLTPMTSTETTPKGGDETPRAIISPTGPKWQSTKEVSPMQNPHTPADKTHTVPPMRTMAVVNGQPTSTAEALHIAAAAGAPVNITYNVIPPPYMFPDAAYGSDNSPFVGWLQKQDLFKDEEGTKSKRIPPAEKVAQPGIERFKKVLASFKPQNMTDFDYFDPLALLLMWAFNIAVFAVGIWQMSIVFPNNTLTSFTLNSPLKGNPYLLIATLWSLYNSIAPYLFLHYCFSSGSSFRWMTGVLPSFSSLILIAGMILLWLMIPSDVGIGDALAQSLQHFYPSQVFSDSNTNYQFVVSLAGAAAPVSLPLLLSRSVGANLSSIASTTASIPARSLLQAPSNVNLLGSLYTGPDYVKSSMPTAYSVAQLSYNLLQFPTGFTPEQTAVVKSVIKTGADYLMRCNLNPDDPANPVFVAQLGDPNDYAVVNEPGYAPELIGKYWSSPRDDPHLTGDAPRRAWLLTRETVGADLLADAAGALAAATLVLRDSDAQWATEALKHARSIYKFATSNITRLNLPASYCDFMNCSITVPVTREITIQAKKADDGKAKCWYADFDAQACLVGYTVDECDYQRSKSESVFTSKASCCGFMAPMWNGTQIQAQGICALPENQTTCYIPSQSDRLCFTETMDEFGRGCTGLGKEVFPSTQRCCDFLIGKGISSPAGVCAPDTCWLSNVVNSTCDQASGPECATTGVHRSETLSLCCEDLYKRLVDLGQKLPTVGNCKKSQNPSPPIPRAPRAPPAPAARPSNSSSGGRGRRSTRLLLQSGAAAPVIDPRTVWPLPDQNINFLDPCKITSRDSPPCKQREVEVQVTVPYFNSTSVFDDLAWGAAWMYLATSEVAYLGDSQRFLDRYDNEELSRDALQSQRELYRSNWDNKSWLTSLLLANMTNNVHYHRRVRQLLNPWVFGEVLQVAPSKPRPPVTSTQRSFENITLEGKAYNIIPTCLPTSTYEDVCGDGIDNDCDGYIDKEDTDCGLFPVIYTPNGVAWSGAPPLPNAANVAFMALAYSGLVEGRASSKLKCWALAQVGHIVGSGVDERSYIVGVGKNPPTQAQHRPSSCPVEGPCDWMSGYYPATPNPQLNLVKGAMVSGPDHYDMFSDDRTSSDTLVTLHDNVAFTGALAGLAATDTRVRSCEAMHGVWQKYVEEADKL